MADEKADHKIDETVEEIKKLLATEKRESGRRVDVAFTGATLTLADSQSKWRLVGPSGETIGTSFGSLKEALESFVDDDDGYTRARRMWFLFMLIIMTAGVTLAVAAYADEHSDDDTCGDWCQIGIIMVVTTVFKMLAQFLLARVLPNTKERSVIERKRTSKCMRTTRWVVGSILLLGLLL